MSDLDARIFIVLHDALSGSAWLIDVMIILSAIGSGWILFGALPLLFMQRTRSGTVALIATLAVTAIVVEGAKGVFTRVRPYRCLEGVKCFALSPPTDYSFPSGHSAGSFAFAAFVATLLIYVPQTRNRNRWFGAIGVLLVALWIGLSRIALGVHFPGDVAVGALLGGTLGHLGARVYLKRKSAEPPSALA